MCGRRWDAPCRTDDSNTTIIVNTQGTPSYCSIKHTDIALYSKCPRFAYSSVGHDVNIAGTQLVTAVCCHVWTAAVTASSYNLR